MRDHGQLLAPLLAGIQAGELLDDAVEPSEQRLELAVRDLSVLHGEVIVVAHKRANGEGTRCKSGTVPPL